MQKINFKKIVFILLLAIAQVATAAFWQPAHINSQKTFFCSACYGDISIKDSLVFESCRHGLCVECMKEYIKAFKGDRLGGLVCPGVVCKRKIMIDEVDNELWKKSLGEDFIHNLIEIMQDLQAESAKVASIDHYDKATKALINKTTVTCTNKKCQRRVERNGGCNHMTCKNCRHEFCWVCKREWYGHYNSFSCNYDPNNRLNGRYRFDNDLDNLPTIEDSFSTGGVILGGAAIASGLGIAYKDQQLSKRPIVHITDLNSQKSEKKHSWLGRKLEASKLRAMRFGNSLRNKLSSKKSNWSSTAIRTGLALETFAALTLTDVDWSHDINTYLRRNHGIHIDLKHPINIALSLAIAATVNPLSRLFFKTNTLEMLVADKEFISLMKATSIREISATQEQLLDYVAKVASINPNDVTRLELRKKFDISISSIDDIDAVLRICLIYVKAKEVINEASTEVNTEEKIKYLQAMLNELPNRALADSVDAFLSSQ